MNPENQLPEGIRPSIPTLNVTTTANMLGYTRQHISRLLLHRKLDGKKNDAKQWRVSARSISTELYQREGAYYPPLPSAAFGNRIAANMTEQEQRLGLWVSKRALRALLAPDGTITELINPTEAEVEYWDRHLSTLAY